MTLPDEAEILLVEDNPNDAELTRRALQRRHLTNPVIWVKDGLEAIEFLLRNCSDAATRPPGVVLLDLKLPKLDGVEVLRRVKSHEKTRQIPVVVLTSSRERSDIAACYALGANSYLVKPVDFDAFMEAIGQLGLYWLLLNQPPENAAGE